VHVDGIDSDTNFGRTTCEASSAKWNFNTNWTFALGRRQQGKVKVEVSSRLAVYFQSVRPGAKPLETHDQRIFFSN
jgi:hypothetical protein